MRYAILVANRGFALASSRMLLIEALQNANCEVVAATADDQYAEQIAGHGVVVEPVNFVRQGFSPVADIRSFLDLWRIYRRYSPELIHHFHAKPMMIGTIAARLALGRRVKIVNTVTGIGQAMVRGGWLRTLASVGYRISAWLADITIFQNPDDQELFISNNWIREDRSRLIISSGVDISRFDNQFEPDGLRILMVTRLLRQKGVTDFIEAAKIVKASYPEVRFQLAGEMEPDHPNGIPESTIALAESDNTIEYLGYLTSVETALNGCFLFVFPSYYREGVPRVVLEAAASGVPAIVADSPGTRNSIVDGVTGYLTPPRDAMSLAEKIAALIKSPVTRDTMGRAARKRIEEEFDLRDISRQQFSVYLELVEYLQ